VSMWHERYLLYIVETGFLTNTIVQIAIGDSQLVLCCWSDECGIGKYGNDSVQCLRDVPIAAKKVHSPESANDFRPTESMCCHLI
jgi:hypothetical protein